MKPLLNVKEYVAAEKEKIKEKVEQYKQLRGHSPHFVIVQFGDLEESNRYIKGKIKDCEEVGIYPQLIKVTDKEIDLNKVLDMIYESGISVEGLIIQEPIPDHVWIGPKIKYWNSIKCLKYIMGEIEAYQLKPVIDVDGFIDTSIIPCTARGVLDYLSASGYDDMSGLNVTIINRSHLVGKPLILPLIQRNATVTIAHSCSNSCKLQRILEESDIVITAVGKPIIGDDIAVYQYHKDFICPDSDHEKLFIDVGIRVDENGKLQGDIQKGLFDYMHQTPVPGGVGLLTRLAALKNLADNLK